MSKPKSDVITPAETMQLTRQQQRFNNPNVTNQFGSTETTFGSDDQAQITQTMSPEMAALVQSQMDFVGQGPQQYQGGNNQGMQDMFNNFAQRLGTGGMSNDAGQALGALLTKPQMPEGNKPMPIEPVGPQVPPPEQRPPGGGGNMGPPMPENPMGPRGNRIPINNRVR